ncbi:hypothetical protein B0H11DRAFT_1194019 [Mycena galericulata]|nr:hypothetical protein B0H11DRAFT_1389800 [Mycena galericulata]KAJ7483932.1 hypothetical protein B0H11DRAFT_1194019 [Mycena galericulata]
MIAYGVDSPLILGVMEIGVFISLVMFGVVALQGYIYFQNCRSDRTGLKLLVGLVLFFELCHSVASCHAIYYFTVVLAGVPELEKPANSYSLSLNPVFETLITALVQSFFAYRLRVLSGRRHISLVCWGLAFLRFVGGMALAAEGFLDVPREPDYFVLQEHYTWLITSALGVGTVLDFLIAVLLCVYIRKLYTPYNLPKSEELINRLITWTIQTGLITSLTSVAVLITFLTMKYNFVWLALYTSLAKMYSNSLLVSLNSRPRHREIVRPASPKSWQWDASRPSSPSVRKSGYNRC